jgi:hypothetical protein
MHRRALSDKTVDPRWFAGISTPRSDRLQKGSGRAYSRIVAASDFFDHLQAAIDRLPISPPWAALVEKTNQDDRKSDHHGGDPEQEDIPHIMSGYALAFRDVRHHRWRRVWPCFEMVA